MIQVYPKYKLTSFIDVMAVDVSNPGISNDRGFIASNIGLNSFTFT